MANSDRLAEVVALLLERDEEFRPFEECQRAVDGCEEYLWALSDLHRLLGYGEGESLDSSVNRAKIAASKSGFSLKEHFHDGTKFNCESDVFLTKYAAYLVIMNADVEKDAVAIAQSYFALQVDRQSLEDEKRLKTRLDVATENHKLQGVAGEAGVQDFPKFNGMGVSGLYGGLNVSQIQRRKGLKKAQHYLDYAGSEELAANLFRITQTAAALRRQQGRSESVACETHKKVGEGVRAAILKSGNTPPEALPAAATKVDSLATQVKRRLTEG